MIYFTSFIIILFDFILLLFFLTFLLFTAARVILLLLLRATTVVAAGAYSASISASLSGLTTRLGHRLFLVFSFIFMSLARSGSLRRRRLVLLCLVFRTVLVRDLLLAVVIATALHQGQVLILQYLRRQRQLQLLLFAL